MTDVRRSIDQLKKDAKRLKRELGISHTEALERIAADQGFSSWESLLIGRTPTVTRIPLLSLPTVDSASHPDEQSASDRVFMLPAFLPIIGSASAGKTVMMLQFARELLNLGFEVCYIAPAELSFSRKPWGKDVGARLARDLIGANQRFTAFDRETLFKLGNHYLPVFQQVPPNSIVLLEDMFSLPTGSVPISKKDPVDLSPLFARGCRVVASLQTLRDLTCLRFGADPESTADIARDSDIALLGIHAQDVSLEFLDAFGFCHGLRDCLQKPLPLYPTRSWPSRPLPFWLIEGKLTHVTYAARPTQDVMRA